MILVDEEVVSKVFWTGATKSGCVGQFKDCFIGIDENERIRNFFRGIILASDVGGACVGVILYRFQLIAQTMPCQSKGFLACQGNSTIRTAATTPLEDVIHYFCCIAMFCTFVSAFIAIFDVSALPRTSRRHLGAQMST
jgi:hypothetical protein